MNENAECYLDTREVVRVVDVSGLIRVDSDLCLHFLRVFELIIIINLNLRYALRINTSDH